MMAYFVDYLGALQLLDRTGIMLFRGVVLGESGPGSKLMSMCLTTGC